MSDPIAIEPFTIAVDEAVLADLRDRIRRTRWPDRHAGSGWDHGADPGYLRSLLATWADEFDWRKQERELNRLAHYRAVIDGVGIHFERITRWSRMPRGGHFAALEEPQLLAEELREFFRPLRPA
jgi:pimeloyl-ACP methyl ester carboxylesterase